MLWLAYRLLTALAAPFWLAFLWLRQGGRLRERLGLLPRRSDSPIWIQAVSVGEAGLALKLGAMLEKIIDAFSSKIVNHLLAPRSVRRPRIITQIDIVIPGHHRYGFFYDRKAA